MLALHTKLYSCKSTDSSQNIYIAEKSSYMKCMRKSVYSLLLYNVDAVLRMITFTSPHVLHHLVKGRAMCESILSRTNHKRLYAAKDSPKVLRILLQYKKVGI
jgi:hypothetical protein